MTTSQAQVVKMSAIVSNSSILAVVACCKDGSHAIQEMQWMVQLVSPIPNPQDIDLSGG